MKVVRLLGGLDALMGNNDQALDYLEFALNLDDIVRIWARSDGAWLDLHNNKRFQTLISEDHHFRNIP